MTSPAPYSAATKPRTQRRCQWRLGPIRVDFFVTGRPWWLPLDRR